MGSVIIASAYDLSSLTRTGRQAHLGEIRLRIQVGTVCVLKCGFEFAVKGFRWSTMLGDIIFTKVQIQDSRGSDG